LDMWLAVEEADGLPSISTRIRIAKSLPVAKMRWSGIYEGFYIANLKE